MSQMHHSILCSKRKIR